MIIGSIGESVIDSYSDNTEILIHQGGSSSSKTFDILQGLLVLGLETLQNKIISVVAPTIPHLKKGAQRDWENILENENLTSIIDLNKADRTYSVNSNLVEFFSAVDGMGAGAKRDILFMNEANLIPYKEYSAYNLRTKKLTILDYNPASSFYVHEKLIGQPSTKFYISTIDDNPARDTPELLTIRRKLDALKDTDPEGYRVYRLGQTGNISGVIFKNVKYVPYFPQARTVYGLDFGYVNDPTALSRNCIYNGEYYGEELCYETGLSDEDIAQLLKANGITRQSEVVADSSDMRLIDKINSYGFNIKPAKKGPDSVAYGISMLKKYRLNLTVNSLNWKREQMNYKWKEDKEGLNMNTPVDNYNHLWDSARYAGELLFESQKTRAMPRGVMN